MMPTPAGKLLGDMWRRGNTDTRINSWSYQPYIEHINDLGVVAFLQDRSNGKILQATVVYKDLTVGGPDQRSSLTNLEIYPNPANHILYMNTGAVTESPGRMELLEMSGKVVLSEYLPAGHQVYQFDIEKLNAGMYLIRWFESDQIRGVSKFVKVR